MHIKTADVVLFLHIGVAVAAFAVAAVLLVGLSQMRKAENVSVLRSWARVAHRAEPMFPVLVLILIVLGAWLIHLSGGQFSWSDGWVLTAVVGLVLMEAYGGMVLAPAGKKLHETVEAEPDGPITQEIRAMVVNRLVWAGAYGNTGVALGILFTMPTKPAGAWSITIVAVAGIAATAIGLQLAGAGERRSAPAVSASHLPG
jgi:hypothetical protein